MMAHLIPDGKSNDFYLALTGTSKSKNPVYENTGLNPFHCNKIIV